LASLRVLTSSAVYPITWQLLEKVESTYGAYNLGGIK
jgi:hypothetical protein